jgi:hypothetical protein
MCSRFFHYRYNAAVIIFCIISAVYAGPKGILVKVSEEFRDNVMGKSAVIQAGQICKRPVQRGHGYRDIKAPVRRYP